MRRWVKMDTLEFFGAISNLIVAAGAAILLIRIGDFFSSG